MYNIEDFKPYTLQKYLGNSPVLVWSKKNGYQFMTLSQRMMATADNLQFKIVGVEK